MYAQSLPICELHNATATKEMQALVPPFPETRSGLLSCVQYVETPPA